MTEVIEGYVTPTEKVLLDPRTATVGHGVFKPDAAGRYQVKGRVTYLHRRMAEVKAPVLIDVGAHVGSYTLLAALHEGATVIAVEPNPEACDVLRANVLLNDLFGRVSAFEVALSNVPGAVLPLLVPFRPDKSGYAHVQPHPSDGLVPAHLQHMTIKTTTVDTLVAGMELDRVDFIKIDVEGWEVFVLEGAEETLRRFQPGVLLEYFAPWTARYKYNPREMLRLLARHGYTGAVELGPTDIYAYPPHRTPPEQSNVPPGGGDARRTQKFDLWLRTDFKRAMTNGTIIA